MTIFELYVETIETGKYNAATMEERIERMYAQDKISAEERVTLLEMADNSAKDIYQIDIPAKLADLERRIAVLESAGVVVWKQGMTTSKGQTVLFDIIKEGILRYCRYDGGRTSTSLSPGKIDGWVILESAKGAVTHTVQKDADGNIILVPVATETVESNGE